MVRFLVLFVILFTGQANAAPALDTKMFSAGGINVDVTEKNAATAREQALKEGQKRALMVVMERLTPEYVSEQLAELVPDDIINMVQDMSVSNEKTSPVRYMATLDVRFNADAVRALLKQNNIPYVRTSGKPIIVLPAYRKSPSGSLMLFEEDNVWLRAWVNRTVESYMMPLFVPMGDATDSQLLSANQILAGDLNQAQKLAKRYNAEGLLVLEMTRRGSAFSVRGYAMDENTSSEIPNFSFTIPPTQNTAKTMVLAVGRVVDHLESVWKREQMVQFNNESTLIAMIPVQDLTQWQVVQSRLDRTPLVSGFTLQAARSGIMQVTLFYAENVDRLKSELQKRSLVLSALPGGVFRLQAAEQANYILAPEKTSALQPEKTFIIGNQ